MLASQPWTTGCQQITAVTFSALHRVGWMKGKTQCSITSWSVPVVYTVCSPWTDLVLAPEDNRSHVWRLAIDRKGCHHWPSSSLCCQASLPSSELRPLLQEPNATDGSTSWGWVGGGGREGVELEKVDDVMGGVLQRVVSRKTLRVTWETAQHLRGRCSTNKAVARDTVHLQHPATLPPLAPSPAPTPPPTPPRPPPPPPPHWEEDLPALTAQPPGSFPRRRARPNEQGRGPRWLFKRQSAPHRLTSHPEHLPGPAEVLSAPEDPGPARRCGALGWPANQRRGRRTCTAISAPTSSCSSGNGFTRHRDVMRPPDHLDKVTHANKTSDGRTFFFSLEKFFAIVRVLVLLGRGLIHKLNA